MQFTDRTIRYGGAHMLRLIIFLAAASFIFVGELALIAQKADAACCMCGQWVRGCTPPGSYYQGQLCLGCARPESDVFQVNTFAYGHPFGAMAENSTLVYKIHVDVIDEGLSMMRGGQCLHRRAELRLLTNFADQRLHSQAKVGGQLQAD